MLKVWAWGLAAAEMILTGPVFSIVGIRWDNVASRDDSGEVDERVESRVSQEATEKSLV